MNCVLWLGPIYAPGQSPYPNGDIGKVTWESPTTILTVSGTGSSYFSSLATKYRDGDGRILPNLLASLGHQASDFDRIGCASFSAGHGLLDPLLLADGDSIAAAVSLDSCFELATATAPKAGYTAFSTLAAQGKKLMVFTGSEGQNAPPLPPTTKGYECAFHAARAGAAAAGTELVQVNPPAGVVLPSCGTWNARGLWVLSYCDRLHQDLINQLGTSTLQAFLAPAMGGVGPGEESGVPWWAWGLGALGAAGAAVVAGVALARRSRR